MVMKGVNKQIVEINCTRDEYIEKAILILNPQKGRLPKKIMDEKAEAYLQTLLPEKAEPPIEERWMKLGLFLLGGLVLALSIALAAALL